MTTKLPLALVLVTLLAGCQTYELEGRWSPLSTIVERPSLPFASDTATTTKGSHVYVVDLDDWFRRHPLGSEDFEAILLHEQEHARRQFDYLGLPGEMALSAWIARYVTDHEFMWSEEQAGYYLEIVHLKDHGLWRLEDTLNVAYSMSHAYRTLGGKRMVGFNEAKQWIEDVLAGRWSP